jgi:hypothetical protein
LCEKLAECLTVLEHTFEQAYPGALAELELRASPLREQWEARGGGLLAALGRVTEPALIVPAADVVLVQPVQGGGGTAHALYNTVCFEAVLANAQARLPEVLRLGWLLAQLHLDLPAYGEALPPGRIQAVGALALLPATLAAGQQVELTHDDPDTLALALRAWPGHADVAQQLSTWWQTYQADRPAWSVALAALERMLAASS